MVRQADLSRPRRAAQASPLLLMLWCGARKERRVMASVGEHSGHAVDAGDGNGLLDRQRRHDGGQPTGDMVAAPGGRP